MLKVEGISINYRKRNVLDNISFTADFGELIGILGVNGSGKSSLLTCIAGLKKPSAGNISLGDISMSQSLTEYRKQFGFVTQENALIPELSAYDNLRIWTSMSRDEILHTLSTPPLSILGCQNFPDVPVKAMSGGMKKRLQLSTVLIRNPRVLLLDEPLSALDMPAREDIMDYIMSFKNAGGLVLAASHEDTVFDNADRILYINNGSYTILPKGSDVHSLIRGHEYEK